MKSARRFSTSAKLLQKVATREEPTGGRLVKHGIVKTTRLPNGLVVVSLENNSPLSSLAVIFNAGCRHETDENEGIVHKLRNCLGVPSKDYSAATISHETSFFGGFLQCSANRDFLTYRIHCLRDNVFAAAESSLSELLCQPKFRDWDLEERVKSMHIDRSILKQDYSAYTLELLHRAAYRQGGLARSLYAPARCIAAHDEHMLYDYVERRLTANNGALVGLNVDHDSLLRYASERLPLRSSADAPPAAPAAKYFGGVEVRKERGGSLAVVALASEGVGLKDPKAQATQAVLCSLLGTGPRVKWCYGGSRLGRAAYAACKSPTYVSSIGLNYTDSGLVGVQYVVDAEHSDAAARAVVGEFRRLASGSGVDGAELDAARRRVKMEALLASQCSRRLLDDLATQTMANLGAAYVDVTDAGKLVDGVTADDVTKMAKKTVASKMSMAAIGNLNNTPYLDDLMKLK